MTMEFINRSVQLRRQHSIAASNQKRKKGLTVAGQLAVPIPGLSLQEELDSTDFLRGFDANNRYICGREAHQMFGFQNECLTALERLLTKSSLRCQSISFL
jgi:hypothetical protein